MKQIPLLLLLVVSAITISAQTSAVNSEPPDVRVVQHKWSALLRPIPDGDLMRVNDDPFRANDEQREWVYNQKQIARANAARVPSEGRLPPAPRNTGNQRTVTDGERSVARRPMANAGFHYLYEVTISNTGKQIRTIDWLYVLVDPDTKREVGSHRFSSKATISTGKSKKLVEQSSIPPAEVVDATKADRQIPGQYLESVVIERIVYADGSWWAPTRN